MAKMGRPTEYSKEVADKIISRMLGGESVRRICEDDEMPSKSTIMLWVAKDEYDDFSDRYESALMIRALGWADELVDIADDGTNDYYKDDNGIVKLVAENVQRSKLRVDTRKWLLSKLIPRFADKQQVENVGTQQINVTIENPFDDDEQD